MASLSKQEFIRKVIESTNNPKNPYTDKEIGYIKFLFEKLFEGTLGIKPAGAQATIVKFLRGVKYADGDMEKVKLGFYSFANCLSMTEAGKLAPEASEFVIGNDIIELFNRKLCNVPIAHLNSLAQALGKPEGKMEESFGVRLTRYLLEVPPEEPPQPAVSQPGVIKSIIADASAAPGVKS